MSNITVSVGQATAVTIKMEVGDVKQEV